VIPFLLVLFLFGIALGIFASAWCCARPGVGVVHLAVPALISRSRRVLSDRDAAAWMQVVAHCCRLVRVRGHARDLAGGSFSATSLACGTGLALLDVWLAYLFFARVHRRAIRTGLIARYSAETVS
jgi:ABC-2 type transport system permease protein